MRKTLRNIEARQGDSRMQWKLKFPFESVVDKLEQAYPNIGAGTSKISDRFDSNMKVAETSYKIWKKYLDSVEKGAKVDPWLRGHLALLKKADESYKKLLRGRDIRDWVNLNARMSRAHESLYR